MEGKTTSAISFLFSDESDYNYTNDTVEFGMLLLPNDASTAAQDIRD